MELCRIPELAAEVAMGPIQDFDFDVAILFSDILFPLDSLGLGLHFSDAKGPQFQKHIQNLEDLKNLVNPSDAVSKLDFQRLALQATRERLPKEKSLIGFVGGPFTLFSYAVGGRHEGSFVGIKQKIPTLLAPFLETLLPVLKSNIQLQLNGGAEVVMIFDTSAGELDWVTYQKYLTPVLLSLAKEFPKKLGLYSRGVHPAVFESLGFTLDFNECPWAGCGVDHRFPMSQCLRDLKGGFVQGNFDQQNLFLDSENFERNLRGFLDSLLGQISGSEMSRWVCGLGHGILPSTPEKNVRRFVEIVREVTSKKSLDFSF